MLPREQPVFIYRGSKHRNSWPVQRVARVMVSVFPSAVPQASLTLTAISISPHAILIIQPTTWPCSVQRAACSMQRGLCDDLLCAALWRIHASSSLTGRRCSWPCGSDIRGHKSLKGQPHEAPLYLVRSGCVYVCRNFKPPSERRGSAVSECDSELSLQTCVERWSI